MQVNYLERDADRTYADWRADRCVNCGLSHTEECRSRYCTSCVRVWLSDTPGDGDSGLPKPETCCDCIASGFGTLEETIAWLRKEGDRIAAEKSAEYSAKFESAAGEIVAHAGINHATKKVA